MGGRARGNTSQTTTTQLPANQQTNVNTLLQGALDYYNTGGPKYYQGSTVAGVTPEEQAGRTAATNYATGAGQQAVNQAVAANNYWLNPNTTTDFSTIPGYNDMRQGIIRDTTRALTEQQLPMIRDDAILNGSYGGTSQQVGEALATGRTADALSSNLANLDLGLYNTNAGMADSALNRSSQMYDLGLAPAQTLQTVGSANRADEQQQIDADVARWNFEQMAPLLNLQALQGLTGSAGQYGGTTRSQGTTGTSDGGASTLGAIASVVMMALAYY